MFHPGGGKSSDYRVFLEGFWETENSLMILLSSAYSMLGLIVIRLVAIIKTPCVKSFYYNVTLYVSCICICIYIKSSVEKKPSNLGLERWLKGD